MNRTCENNVSLCEPSIGHTFTNKLTCLRSLNTSGETIHFNGAPMKLRPNKEMAVLGDAILRLILCERWYPTGFTKAQWNQASQRTLTNDALAKVGFRKGWDAFIIRNPGSTGTVSMMTMADTVEALICAIYEDAGMEAAKRFVARMELDHPYLAPGTTTTTFPSRFG